MTGADPLETIENRTYDEIAIGDSATLVKTLRPEDIQMFAILSGDINPTHVDPEYARSSSFREVVAHGMWGGALISNVLGTQFPGPGTGCQHSIQILVGFGVADEQQVLVGDPEASQ